MSGLTFDLSGFLALPSSVKLDYQHYWNTFSRIQAYNSNISTIRSGGEKGVDYYTFLTYEEVTSFTQGQYLHLKRYPDSNWATVSKD